LRPWGIEALNHAAPHTPIIPRRGVSEDIAPAVAFLASEEAGWITGQMLVVDAGMVRW